MIGKNSLYILLLLILCSCSWDKNKSAKDNETYGSDLTLDSSEFRLDTLLTTIESTSNGLNFKSNTIKKGSDSVNLKIINLDEYDKNLYKLYRETEVVLKKDFKISTDEMDEYMQLLINDGALVAPHIIDSVTYKIIPMTYSEYKKYRRENPIRNL